MPPPDEESIDEKDVIDIDETAKPSEPPKSKYRNVTLAVPPPELERIKKENNCDDLAAAIIYHNERKNPQIQDAVKKINTKERRNRSPSAKGGGGVPDGAYIPQGVQDVIDTAGAIQSDQLKTQYEDQKAKAAAYEMEREELAKRGSEPAPKSRADAVVEEYVEKALDTHSKITEAAVDKLIHGDKEEKKKEPTEEEKLKKTKEAVLEAMRERGLMEGGGKKDKTFDEELLGELKKDLIVDVQKKLKGEGVKVTPEMVGQIINGVGSIFDKLDPVFAGYNTKQNILASKEKMITIAQIHASMNADNIRTLKDMVYLAKENKDVFGNPVVADFIKNMNAQSQMVMGVIRKELEEPLPTTQSASKKREQVDLDDIPVEDVPKKKRKVEEE